jgi:hypothetical protein
MSTRRRGKGYEILPNPNYNPNPNYSRNYNPNFKGSHNYDLLDPNPNPNYNPNPKPYHLPNNRKRKSSGGQKDKGRKGLVDIHHVQGVLGEIFSVFLWPVYCIRLM